MQFWCDSGANRALNNNGCQSITVYPYLTPTLLSAWLALNARTEQYCSFKMIFTAQKAKLIKKVQWWAFLLCLYFSNWFIILIIIVTYAYASVIYELWDKEFLYFPWVCWGMGWIYGWGLFLETNCQYPRLILHNILHINQDFRRGKSTKSIFIWKLYSIPSIKTSCWPVFDICHYQFVITSF